jgi:hypothetical protein
MPDGVHSTNPPAISTTDDLYAAIQLLSGHTATIARDLRALMGTTGEGLRPAMERLVEDLLSALDSLEGDPDLEPNGDELDASYPENPNGRAVVMLMHPHEDGGDDEPALGWTNGGDYRNGQVANANCGDDREQDDGEDGIGDHDGLQEQTEGEPSLGSFDRLMNQEDAWKQRNSNRDSWWHAGDDLEADRADREPSLGWTLDSEHGDTRDREIETLR